MDDVIDGDVVWEAAPFRIRIGWRRGEGGPHRGHPDQVLVRELMLETLAMGADDPFLHEEAAAAVFVRAQGVEHVESWDATRWRWIESPCVGWPLSWWTNAGRALPVAPACAVAEAVGHALQSLHDARDRSGGPLHALHRDVTPRRVVLTPSGDIVLTHPAFARLERFADESGPAVTPASFALVSPEQVRADTLTPASDVYQAAAMLYLLLTGATPLRAATALDMARAIRDYDPVPPSAVAPWVPTELDACVLAALAKDPQRRPINAAAWVENLAAVRTRAGWAPAADDRAALAREAATCSPPSVLGHALA